MSSNTSNQQSPPDESLLTTLQELVDAWVEEDFETAVTSCSALLKKRKMLDPTVAHSIQRLLLQCYLQQQKYAKVSEWSASQANTNKNYNNNNGNAGGNNRDLVLYAQYRQEEYESVSQQASKESPLEQHLLAQSYFHLNQMNPALRVYQDLLKNRDPQDIDNDAKMELLTNAIAVVTSTVVPYVSLGDNDLPLLKQAESFLEEHPEYCDLALNVGTLQCLAGCSTTQWLDAAKDHCTDPDDMVPIDINQNWSLDFWQVDEVDYKNSLSKGTGAQMAVAQLNQALLQPLKPLATSPHPKWNALQVRMYWYNRAVQQYQSQQLVECQESCQSLKKTLSKNKKKKDSQPASPAEWWWQMRIDVILAYVQHKQHPAAASEKLQERLEALQKQSPSPTIDHAIAYLQLHMHALKNANPTKEQKIAVLKSLPASIQAQPAVVATVEALESASSLRKSKTGSSKSSSTDRADVLLDQGQYATAAKLYEECLPAPSSGNVDQLASHLKRVQALALSDQHEESAKLWDTLKPLLDATALLEDPTGAANDGEALETKALPRSKTSSSSSATTSATLAATAANLDDAKPKRSKESVLRQRARKREAYLKSLEEKGDYNPDRPTQPNAERWIPKHERSRARRRGQNANSRSAQGGGSQADAQRLDAAARRAGMVPSSAGPSTANLKVSQGGRKAGRRRG